MPTNDCKGYDMRVGCRSTFSSRAWIFVVGLLTSGALFAHGISEESRQRMIDGGNLEYFRLGAEHMITGVDHLLFLFGVMFFLTRFIDIVKYVSAFTIGHTITLVGATYLQITANFYLVDAFIALTVVYKGFENLDGFRKYLNTASPNLLLMVLLFGLVHGFGLSTRLQQLPVAEDGAMLWHILSFNLGVEVGQIIALVIMWGLLRIWQRRGQFLVFSKVANAGLIVAGVALLAMQLHGYGHTAHADSFPISRDDHSHAHLDMLDQGHSHNPDGSHVGSTSGEENGHTHGPGSDHSHEPPNSSEPSLPPHY
ncbi:MAG TPA: HupE/UreJ family protein [Woeseiaceae bacterium]|nr:HupE/UreJ family protein [Woeseiaceae bacterium]